MLTDWITLPIVVAGQFVTEIDAKLELSWAREFCGWYVQTIHLERLTIGPHGDIRTAGGMWDRPISETDRAFGRVVADAVDAYWQAHRDEIEAEHGLTDPVPVHHDSPPIYGVGQRNPSGRYAA